VSSISSTIRAKYPLRELEVVQPDGTSKKYPLQKDSLTLGRNANNDLSFPEDPILSRQHLKFEYDGGEWCVTDLGSKNGTLLNDQRLEGRVRLKSGDRIGAGRVVISYNDPRISSRSSVVFVEERENTASGATMVIRLDRVLTDEPRAFEAALGTDSVDGIRRTEALIHAGRELVGHRPLDELFPVILKLATGAVGARRGLIATVEEGDLFIRATQGEGFRISTAVRDKVLKARESLLVRDAGSDEVFRQSRTIVEQRVRSLMAVPLQTDAEVIGLVYVDSPDFIRPFTPEDLSLLTVMANTAAIRIEHARLAEIEQNERLIEKEMEQAAEIQRSLLPPNSPRFPGLDIAGHSMPSRSVGGDYFDYLRLPDGRPAVLVADVAGKGLPAALLMTSLQARVQILAETETDPGSFVTRLNRSVARHCPANRFITFFVAVYNPENGEILYANAGHNPPYLLKADRTVHVLEGGGPPLGIMRNMTYATQSCLTGGGDTLMMYSDGVPEGVNAAGEEFGDDRFISALLETHGSSAEDIISAVRSALANFVKDTPASDDVTLVAVRRKA